MYERRYGSRYHETKDLRPQEIAKLIRLDIKAAKAEGRLPADLNTSVRFRWSTHSPAIDVTVRDAVELWERCPGYRLTPGTDTGVGCPAYGCPATYQHDRLTDEGERINAILESILNAYNYDGSEHQVDYFDVRFYGHVTVESATAREWRLAEKARQDARKAAKAA